ncbi:MAG: ABC transporter permease [Candidatus Latescibacteria bacterium]|nr:ABC transporter permease [Candidatus Latescibacterota bacterium]
MSVTIASVPDNGSQTTLQTDTSSFWRDASRSRLLVSGMVIVGMLLSLAFLAPALTRWHVISDPMTQFPNGLDVDGLPIGPGQEYRLGTDSLGRDLLSRVVHGTRISLTVGVVAMFTALFIGVSVGVIAGYFGTWVNTVLMRGTDVMMTIPGLLLAIAFAGLMDGRDLHLHPDWLAWHWLDVTLERGVLSVLLVIGIVSWTWIARVVRSQVITVKEREFVEASLAMGCGHGRIILRHLLPNILPTVIIVATLSTAGTVLLDAGLSYLGVGVPPPAPSWGTMIADGQPYFIVAPHITVVPGIAIVLTVVGFNLLGQGLQDVLDPYEKGRR